MRFSEDDDIMENKNGIRHSTGYARRGFDIWASLKIDDLDNPFAPSQYCKAEDILLLLCNTYVSPIKNCCIEYFLIAELATIQLNWQGMRLVAHQWLFLHRTARRWFSEQYE